MKLPRHVFTMRSKISSKRPFIALATLCYTMGGLCTAFFLSWIMLAHVDFLYGFWHDKVGIAEGIEEYAPQNRFREGFGETSRRERIRLFAAINTAVHNRGEGLADIIYRSPSVDDPQPLLRAPEIVHLQDVANLLSTLKSAALTAALIWLLSIVATIVMQRALPSLKHQLLIIGAGLLIAALVVFLVGPVAVFNQLHIWIFPADHQWFFYYQDSLMSTMMLAPRLFGWITAAWIPLALACFLVLHGVAVLVNAQVGGKR